MLTTNQLRQIAFRTGARDLVNVEIEVLLTYILQLFHDHGLHEHLAFKGGTMLRKMIFGSRGRLSTDLDFTCRSDISVDDLTTRCSMPWLSHTTGLSFVLTATATGI